MLFTLNPDDIPKLSKKESEIEDLIIVHRGWVFRFSYGWLWAAFPQ